MKPTRHARSLTAHRHAPTERKVRDTGLGAYDLIGLVVVGIIVIILLKYLIKA